MATNWPPATAPTWPPPEFNITALVCSDWSSLIDALKTRAIKSHVAEWSVATPTAQERSAFFNSVRCDDGHQVTGRMLVSAATGVRYPFAVCNDATHRALLTLFEPYELTRAA